MFCGQLINRKNPLFFIDLCTNLNTKINNFNVLIIGDGPLNNSIQNYININKHINIDYYSYIKPDDLSEYYFQSYLFIFPSELEPWGVVVNESIASSVPVLLHETSGCANELVFNEYNGYIFQNFNIEEWSNKIIYLLNNKYAYNIMSMNCIKSIKDFNYKNSTTAIDNSIKFSLLC
jgi:glycosyltransferase involved in cell wall biosynthesis